jgi:hypothetical protein
LNTDVPISRLEVAGLNNGNAGVTRTASGVGRSATSSLDIGTSVFKWRITKKPVSSLRNARRSFLSVM